jgi:hypothetical protein
MNSNYTSSYRGCSITARCSEVRPPTNFREFEALPSMQSSRFIASFCVTVDGADAEVWQQFPDDQFDTHEHAAKNALAIARQAIDVRLAQA